ncbi:MAG TPA: RNA methyltransferase [Bacteroidales bacterium]|nr:RNA methyltransferase [Bacteroidales bacterium]
MAYDNFLAERIYRILKDKNIAFSEKKMMGGLSFMVNEKMCLGIIKDNLMIRIDPEIQDDLLKRTGCRMMDFTKRPMKGFLYVEPIAVDLESDLEEWIQYALDFNPKAKKSKK